MIRVSSKRGPHWRRGQAVVEFALILPVFMLLVFGAIEFGRAYYDLHLLTNAAREGARRGSLPGQLEAEVQAAVDNFLESVGVSGQWTTTVEVRDVSDVLRAGGLTDAQEGDRVLVIVNYDFQVLTGSLLPGFSGVVPLKGRCVYRHE